jgi:hypothetical protein
MPHPSPIHEAAFFAETDRLLLAYDRVIEFVILSVKHPALGTRVFRRVGGEGFLMPSNTKQPFCVRRVHDGNLKLVGSTGENWRWSPRTQREQIVHVRQSRHDAHRARSPGSHFQLLASSITFCA